jgi:Cys-Gly metallodipeptidase DUG1
MTDLIKLMSRLVDSDGKILIPGVDDMVEAASEDEKYLVHCICAICIDLTVFRAIYNSLDYSIADIEEAVGAAIALSSDKATVLMGRMRYPSLSLHGIEGAFHGVGGKTVIPSKVGGKFSIRCICLFAPLFLVIFNGFP